MLRKRCRFWAALIGIAGGAWSVIAEVPEGLWRVYPLDSRTLALGVDYSDYIDKQTVAEKGDFLRTLETREPPVKDWSIRFYYRFALGDSILKLRPQAQNLLQNSEAYELTENGKSLKIAGVGFWSSVLRQTRINNLNTGKEIITDNADMGHFVFLSLAQEMMTGQEYRLKIPTGEQLAFSYRPDQDFSRLFKFNQLGFSPRAARKYAYIGAWLGDAGAMDLSRYWDAPFEAVDAVSGEVALVGKVQPRIADPKGPSGAPFTGEMVGELDISGLNRPGRYFLRVPGIGRSHEFVVGEESVGDAFFWHMRGLFLKRCGMAKEEPYTAWTSGACHLETLQGNFPPDDTHYRKAGSGEKRDWGFFDAKGNSIQVRQFDLIAQNMPENPEVLPVSGGWHDAGDYDRRNYHLQIVNDLLAAYLINPQAFSDGQLHLPESGNGVPDLLDEVIWGMEVWRKAQKSSGGVGTWIEATSHPAEWRPSEDRQAYFLSNETRGSSMEYAAHAAMLALALREAGMKEQSALYADSAARAFDYAWKAENRLQRSYQYKIDKVDQVITYREPKYLAIDMTAKAAFNLYVLTGAQRYRDVMIANEKEILKAIGALSWKSSPFFFIEIARFGAQFPEMAPFVKDYRTTIMKSADEHMEYLNYAYPYRLPWYAPDHRYVKNMAWGNMHPLRRARCLAVAWYLSGQQEYRDGVFLANDWHNGGNPLGQSMTSGIGWNYPVYFLDLPSFADGIDEFVPGITPYRYMYRVEYNGIRYGFGLYYDPRKDHDFVGSSEALPLKGWGITPDKSLEEVQTIFEAKFPVWRRWVNFEGLAVGSSEFTVWETIAPAAATLGSVLSPGYDPAPAVWQRRPVEDIRTLEGYLPLP